MDRSGPGSHRAPTVAKRYRLLHAIADAIGSSLRVMILFATFTGLRLGELPALRRSRLDL